MTNQIMSSVYGYKPFLKGQIVRFRKVAMLSQVAIRNIIRLNKLLAKYFLNDAIKNKDTLIVLKILTEKEILEHFLKSVLDFQRLG